MSDDEPLTITDVALLLGQPSFVGTVDSWRALAMERGAQLDRIAAILRRFHGAEISASSVQPILDLALEMNPDLTAPLRI